VQAPAGFKMQGASSICSQKNTYIALTGYYMQKFTLLIKNMHPCGDQPYLNQTIRTRFAQIHINYSNPTLYKVIEHKMNSNEKPIFTRA
jgi:hypothetical protein